MEVCDRHEDESGTNGKFNCFNVCLLDVLGFESRLRWLGLNGILEKYVQLIDVVHQHNASMEQVFGTFNFTEGAYWLEGRHVWIVSRIYATYASDSILLFSHTFFPENRYPALLDLTEVEIMERGANEASCYLNLPIPCDPFLDLCSEVICRSIEIGLPLRGALTMGDAVLHPEYGVYVGIPLVDAARLEHAQQMIGASFANSFMTQIVPERFSIQYSQHLKSDVAPEFSGHVLDWPNHWRRTRKTNIEEFVETMNTDQRFASYYQKTLDFVETSNTRPVDLREDINFTSIIENYPQFSYGSKLRVRLAMEIPGQ